MDELIYCNYRHLSVHLLLVQNCYFQPVQVFAFLAFLSFLPFQSFQFQNLDLIHCCYHGHQGFHLLEWGTEGDGANGVLMVTLMDLNVSKLDHVVGNQKESNCCDLKEGVRVHSIVMVVVKSDQLFQDQLIVEVHNGFDSRQGYHKCQKFLP